MIILSPKSNFEFRLMKNIVVIGIFYLTTATIYSEYIFFRYRQSLPYSLLTYQLNPNNWYSAVNTARLYMKSGRNIEAKKILDVELGRRPHNYLALGVLAELNFKQHKHDEGCRILKNIDTYFNNKSSHHTFIKNNCSQKSNVTFQ